jgi:hypothetical protein
MLVVCGIELLSYACRIDLGMLRAIIFVSLLIAVPFYLVEVQWVYL